MYSLLIYTFRRFCQLCFFCQKAVTGAFSSPDSALKYGFCSSYNLFTQALKQSLKRTSEFNKRVVHTFGAFVKRVLAELSQTAAFEFAYLAQLLVRVIITLDSLTNLGVVHSRIIPVGIRPFVGLLLYTFSKLLQIFFCCLLRMASSQQERNKK